MTTKKRKQKLILGGDPEGVSKTPLSIDFGEKEYVEAPAIAVIADALIKQRLGFESLREAPDRVPVEAQGQRKAAPAAREASAAERPARALRAACSLSYGSRRITALV